MFVPIRSLAAVVASAALLATSVSSAFALQLTPTSHVDWVTSSYPNYLMGEDPQAFAGPQPLIATNYLTTTVRSDTVGARINFRITLANGQSFSRFDTSGQTNGLNIGSVQSGIAFIELLPGTSVTAKHISVCVDTHKLASCRL